MRFEFEFRNGQARNEKLLADVQIIFGNNDRLDGLALLGASVWQTKNGISVTLPSRKKAGGGYFDLIQGPSEGVKKLKDDIKAAYEKAVGERSTAA